MPETPLSEQESLQLIGEMISKAKRSYVSKGIASMVWGTLIIICSLITWAQVQFNFRIGFDIWLLVFVAVIPQIIYSVRESKQKGFIGHDSVTMNFVWTAFGICIFILSFYNGNFGTKHTTTLFMMLYGIPTFITGGVFSFRPMIYGGIVCWVLSVISVFTGFATDMLFMAASGLFAWLIPGILLWKNYKKQKAQDVQ